MKLSWTFGTIPYETFVILANFIDFETSAKNAAKTIIPKADNSY